MSVWDVVVLENYFNSGTLLLFVRRVLEMSPARPGPAFCPECKALSSIYTNTVRVLTIEFIIKLCHTDVLSSSSSTLAL